MKTGTANLPLHSGRAPRWLFEKMKILSREIILAIVYEKGEDEVIRRLSDPFWFQALGCILGFDWHSSGLTTTTCGAIKEGLKKVNKETGIFVAGGKGKSSLRTPEDIKRYCEKTGQGASNLVYASRMSAKVDNAAVQDGYSLYHHNLIFSKSGLWTVIQQGMNTNNKMSRRYHWLSDEVEDYVCEPHIGICCDSRHNRILNMVDKKSGSARETCSEIAKGEKPQNIVKQLKKLRNLNLPRHHRVVLNKFSLKKLSKPLRLAKEREGKDFESLLSVKGVGPSTIRALSLISEIIYKTPSSIKDPAKYSFAHGGKDGYPYPVNKKGYEDSIRFLHKTVKKAKVGRADKIKALKKLEKKYNF